MSEITYRIQDVIPTHKCKVCGALWRYNEEGAGSWTLRSPTCGSCCDNALMGDQIEPITVTLPINSLVIT